MKHTSSFLLCAMGLAALGCTMNTEPESSVEEPLEEASSELSAVDVQLDTGEESVVPVKNAMTWSLLKSASSGAYNAYALVGADAFTNPYQGDTLTSNVLPVLCINENNPPYPGAGVIGSPVQTPGGAWRKTWSGGTVALTAPVKGTTLTSLAVANALCASQFGAGYRMAEFHDGDATLWSGWDFWGAVLNAYICPFEGTRYWVSINGQNANPW